MLTPQQRELRDRLRAYLADVVTPAEREAMLVQRHGPVYREIVRRLGRDGWLGLGWPVEHGGHGLGLVEQQIFVNEVTRADVPWPSVTLQTVGPVLQEHGTAEQRAFFLPRILSGELHFAIGYSEPEAGTDLAALTTRAVRDGDHYVVNGQKLWTTGGHDADYVWLACRTDPDAPKHKGISILIVDTRDPGYSWTPIITSDGAHHVNATYFSDVRVPVERLVGEENRGWRLITAQLNHERVMLGPAGRVESMYHRVLDWAAQRETPSGLSLLQVPSVRRTLAEVYARLRVNHLLNLEVAGRVGATLQTAVADASTTKVYGAAASQYTARVLGDLLAEHAGPDDPAADELARWLDVQAKRHTVLTFGGGVDEIQRELIASVGLGMPRVAR
ncbi:acyl-CoA dehydrogenase family protein [Spongisporangium articulatum]|uniref:Acyl-CoA dehydrogenase family protein n=1 Tax=Spongisporangium articulatum TaxID=3362603 RepID=A0ABW8AUU2_9ACTN